MPIYQYSGETLKYIPENFVAENHIVGTENPLGAAVSDYMQKTVTKILLAKNKALLNDQEKAKNITGEVVEENKSAEADEADLDKDYLKNVVIKNADGQVITSEEEMIKWVSDNFYFCLQDEKMPNAWIHTASEGEEKNVIAVTAKMIECAENAAQFEGIVAHELGHYFVAKRYGNLASNARAINEKMADMHALDCLVYMGKNPDEYSVVFQQLNGLYGDDMDPIDKVISAMLDEHGGEASRVKDINDYNMAVHGEYLDEYYLSTNVSPAVANDDAAFSDFQKQVESLHDAHGFISSLEEEAFLKDEKFKEAINPENGRIDFSKIKYEDMMDKLIEVGKNEGIKYSSELKFAAEILQKSSKEGLQITPELEAKATLFMAVVTDSCYLNMLRRSNEESNKRTEVAQDKYIKRVIARIDEHKEIPDNIVNFVIREEYERTGTVLTPREVGERLKEIPELNGTSSNETYTYKGREFTNNSNTNSGCSDFLKCARSEKELESENIIPKSDKFNHLSILNKQLDQLVSPQLHEVITFDHYKETGEFLTAREVAEKLEETIKDVPDVWTLNRLVEYNGKEYFVGENINKPYLALYRPNSHLLTDEDRIKRMSWIGLSSSNIDSSIYADMKQNLDDLQMAVSYPEINFAEYREKMARVSDKEALALIEKELSAKIKETQSVVKVKPYSFFVDDAIKMEWFIDKFSSSSIDTPQLLKYSRFAMDMPSFEMPKKEEAVGQPLPWNEHNSNSYKNFGLQLIEGKSFFDAVSSDFVVADDENLFKNADCCSLVKFPDGKPYKFVADENGMITAVGEEAEKQLADRLNEDKQNVPQEISAHFREKVKVLDAFVALSEVSAKEKQGQPLVEADIYKRQEALLYLCGTENLEPCIINWSSLNPYSELTDVAKKQKELAYENMPAAEMDLIKEDMEVLKKSAFYQKYMTGKDAPQNPEDMVKFMHETISWNMGENTVQFMQDMVPPVYNVLKRREKTILSSQEVYGRMVEKSMRDYISQNETVQKMEGSDKEEMLKMQLSLKMMEEKNYTSLIQYSNERVGIANDESLYLREQVPYFEKMRGLMGMKDTIGNPEVLYENLSAPLKEEDLIKTPEHKQLLLNQYYDITHKRDISLEEQRQIAEINGKTLGIEVGSPKFLAVRDSYKMAEYETARYINNPQNPPLDVAKLLKSYPMFKEGVEKRSSEQFQDMLANYILEKTDFKEKSFYEQKEIFDLMQHKGLFNKEKETKAVFAKELMTSFEKLPENEKEKAACSMLQDSQIACQSYSSFSHVISDQTSSLTNADLYFVKEYFTKAYADKFVERVGVEPLEGDVLKNGKIAGKQDVETYHAELKEFMQQVNQTMGLSGAKENLFALVAEGIEAQPELARVFANEVKHQDSSQDLSGKNEVKMRGVNAFNELLSVSPNSNVEMMTFLTEPYSDEKASQFRENLAKAAYEDMTLISERAGGDKIALSDFQKIVKELASKEDLRNMHDEFWAAPLETRATVMQRLLNNATQDNNARAIDICLDKYVDKDNPYYEVTKEVLNTLYKDGTRDKHYSHDKARFMIGAMMVADKPDALSEGKQMSVGDALARFCSSNGPAWVKFGQALSNLPMLPEDIRKPMSVLKDKAVSKTRWEILAEVDENMKATPEAKANIRRFGKMLGAGSFWETLSVETKDGSNQVLQIMAPGAKKDATTEFAKIVRTVEDLSSKNAQYAVLDRIVKRAQESAEVETNIPKGFDQYVAAKKNYENFSRVEVNGVKFELNLMPWTEFNQDEQSGKGFKMMEMADGKGLAKLDCSPDEKRVLAAGYVVTELGILLGGKAWDIDRHGGQQNFDIKRDKDGNIEKVVIGIYDTGALRPAPNEEEKAMIANFYASVIKASIKGDDVVEVMFNEVKKLEDKGMNATYVSDVQRGCIAINDLVEYQKKGVDKDGNPVEAQSFGQKDFIKFFGAVLTSGAIDRQIADTMLEKIVTDKGVYMALAREGVNATVNRTKNMFRSTPQAGNEPVNLNIVLEARGILNTREHNQAIDAAHPRQSSDNVFSQTTPSKSSKKGFMRKVVRNLQALQIKYTRSKGKN